MCRRQCDNVHPPRAQRRAHSRLACLLPCRHVVRHAARTHRTPVGRTQRHQVQQHHRMIFIQTAAQPPSQSARATCCSYPVRQCRVLANDARRATCRIGWSCTICSMCATLQVQVRQLPLYLLRVVASPCSPPTPQCARRAAIASHSHQGCSTTWTSFSDRTVSWRAAIAPRWVP